MNAYEIRDVEARLAARPRLPLSEYDFAAIEQAARRERAEYIGALLQSLYARITRWVRGTRELAQDCTDARLHHG